MSKCLSPRSWGQGQKNNNVRILVVCFRILAKALVSLLFMMGMDLQAGRLVRLLMIISPLRFRSLRIVGNLANLRLKKKLKAI